jgi:hypothetical protein
VDKFVEEFAQEILSSQLPEQQQQVLVKTLTRQNHMLRDQLEKLVDQEHHEEDSILFDSGLGRTEDWLDEFQSAMERVQNRFSELRAQKKDSQSKKESDEEMEDEAEEAKSDSEAERKEPVEEDLEQLLQEQGQDVEFEFLADGEPVSLHKSLLEVFRQRPEERDPRQHSLILKEFEARERELREQTASLAEASQAEGKD